MEKIKIGWFSSGRDKAAIDLLGTVQKAIRQGEIEAQIIFVFSNREKEESRSAYNFLDFANDHEGLPVEAFSSKKFKPDLRKKNPKKWRQEYDSKVIKRLRKRRFLPADLIVLAGYMLIVGEEMCQRYKMINLHPAAPSGPTGSWQEVIWQLIENGATETGAMMHLVTPELDKGPPVTFATFPIRGGAFAPYWQEIIGYSLEEIKEEWGEDNSLFKTVRAHGLAREFPLIVATLKAFAQGKVMIEIEKGKVVNVQGKVINGYNLSSEINAVVKEKLAKEG